MAAPPPYDPITVAEAVERYLLTLAARVDAGTASPASLATYAADLADLARLAGGGTVLDDLEADDLTAVLACHARIPDRRRTSTPADWDTFARDRRGVVRAATGPARRSAASRARFASAVRSLLAWAEARHHIRANPMAGLDTIAAPSRATGARLGITPTHAAALLATTSADPAGVAGAPPTPGRPWVAVRDELILRLLAEPGLRVSEVAAADIADVRTGTRPATDPTAPGHAYRYLQVIGKGRKARHVPLSPAADELLGLWLAQPRPAPPTSSDAAALLVSVRGRRLAPRDIQRMLDRRLGQMPAGLRTRVTPHGLRHTAATTMAKEAGVDPTTVADVLGHSSVTTTSVYFDTSDIASADAVAAASSVYRAAAPGPGPATG